MRLRRWLAKRAPPGCWLATGFPAHYQMHASFLATYSSRRTNLVPTRTGKVQSRICDPNGPICVAASVLSAELRGLDDFALADSEYASELNEHRVRLASIGLVPDEGLQEVPNCPLCASPLGQATAEARNTINRSLGRVASRLDYVARDRPLISRARSRINSERQAIQNRLNDLEEALSSIVESEEISAISEETFHAESFVKGRIAQFLDSTTLTEDSELERMRRELERLNDLVDRLTEELDPEAMRSRVTSILNVVGHRLTDHARWLGLEHSATGARIDPYRLTIVADTPQGPAYMGYRRDWVGHELGRLPSFCLLGSPGILYFPI